MASGPFPNIRRWPLPYTSFEGQRRGRWLMYADTRRSTIFIDLDTWPPAPAVIVTEYVTSFDVQPDGRLVVCSMRTRPASEYMVRVHPPSWPARAAADPSEVIPPPIRGSIY